MAINLSSTPEWEEEINAVEAETFMNTVNSTELPEVEFGNN